MDRIIALARQALVRLCRARNGPTTAIMQEYAKKYEMVIVVPIYEEAMRGVYYNTAAVIDADGTYLASIASSISLRRPASGRSFSSSLVMAAIRSSKPVMRKLVSISAMTVTFPKAGALGLNGAEIVFNPSATVAGLSEYLWKLEQPAAAVANTYYVGGLINRVGMEAPWNIGEFYGQSYFVNPRGQFEAMGSRDQDEIIIADLDLSVIDEVRKTWQFYHTDVQKRTMNW